MTDNIDTFFGPSKEEASSYFDVAIGKWIHTMRQSWIGDTDICPERARRQLVGTYPRVESDAAAVGTAVHAGIEYDLRSWMSNDTHVNMSDAVDVALAEFDRIAAMENFVWNKYDHDTAYALIQTHTVNWFNQILPRLEKPTDVEWHFNVPFHEDDQRIIRFSGTCDYVRGPRLKDWKTSGRPYQDREKQNNNIQSSVYTYALAYERGELDQGPWYFDFEVMIHPTGKQPARVQTVTVIRHQAHWEWLRKQCVNWAQLIEADLPQWPLRDTGALCSEKWCSCWATCRGATLERVA